MSEKLLQADNGVTVQEGEGSMPPLVQEAPLLPDAPQMPIKIMDILLQSMAMRLRN